MTEFVQAFLAAITLTGSFDSETMGVVSLSLRVSLSASIIAMVIGEPLAGPL
jgi:tungstate transport system permease protein